MQQKSGISDRGYWLDTSGDGHYLARGLATKLIQLFIGKSVIDLGCGVGKYVECLRSVGIDCDGVDGNPNTPEMTNGLCEVCDLSQEVSLSKKYDWALCLEVGEHVPRQHEEKLIKNILNHATEGVVISWAVPGQDGRGHVNCRENSYIHKLFSSDFIHCPETEESLRTAADIWWFKNTLMVFRCPKHFSSNVG